MNFLPPFRLALATVFLGLSLAAQAPAPAPKAAQAPTGKPVMKKVDRNKQLDMNTATKTALKKLPGITDAIADRIIKGRPYLTKTRLVTQEVLTLDQFQKIRDRIKVVPMTQPKAPAKVK